MRYFVAFSYFGKQYHGWQRQPNALTVQQRMEDTFSVFLRTQITMTGAGRTDTGVHARQMYAHFDSETIRDSKDLVGKLNAFLPDDIAISRIFKVKEDAHARFDALERTYEYWVTTQKDPFYIETAYYVKNALSIDVLNKAASVLLEYTDFECFSKSNTDVKTYQCDLKKAVWRQEGGLLVFTITADRFLRNMVRAIVGTLLEVAMEKLRIEDIRGIIESKDRAKAGFSVPAKGLYLVEVKYPENIVE